MKENQRIAAMAIGILLLLGAAAYFWLKPSTVETAEAELASSPVLATEPAPTPAPGAESPPDHYPLPAVEPEAPLPALAESAVGISVGAWNTIASRRAASSAGGASSPRSSRCSPT